MNWSKYVCLIFYYVLGFTIILASTSCQSEKKSSILILAFDRLPSDDVTCSDEHATDNFGENSGFVMLCKESIRFTHSYTTSLQPAAAMGSLLTGTYPFDHKLHRSFDRISEQSQLITEIARDKKMRTSFFSGSPNILKKTGLSKFFEIFDDSSSITEKNLIKEFKSQTAQFFDWYADDPKPFFSVIYNSELQSTDSNHSMVLEKIDENLATFFKKLKSEKIWESTTILLIGLNGMNKFERIGETEFQNLHSENTKVTTLIKLPRAQGDEGVYWKDDTIVQFADIGFALKKILSVNIQIPEQAGIAFSVLDIPQLRLDSKKQIKQSDTNDISQNQRKILIEAPNTWSQNLSWIQFAVIQNQDLYIDLKKPVVYNTLTDGLETTNIYRFAKQKFEQIETDLSILKNNLNLIPAPEEKNKKIYSTDVLMSANINLENVWGLLQID
jgi:hypothetical protein